MSGSETTFTARFHGPEIIEAGRTNVVTASIYRDGAIVTLTQSGSTLTVWNAANVKVVDAQAVTVTANVASYSISSAIAVSTAISDGWRFEWSLVISGIAYVFRRSGSLVYRRLYPTITDADLLQRHHDLTIRRPSTILSYQDYLDVAWGRIESLLVNSGKRPWLIMDPSALDEALDYKTMEGIYADFSTGGQASADWQMMERYEGKFEAAWARLTYPQADPATGADIDPGKRQRGSPSLWLCQSAALRGGF